MKSEEKNSHDQNLNNCRVLPGVSDMSASIPQGIIVLVMQVAVAVRLSTCY